MGQILVVEDETAIRDNIAEIVAISGHQATIAVDGLDAQLKLEGGYCPDLILSDLMMPNKDGYQLLEWVRSHASLYDVPTVLLTARTDPRDMRRGMSMGADDYLIKPFDIQELIACIELRLKMSRRAMRLGSSSDLLSA